jgi:hypothetical protein
MADRKQRETLPQNTGHPVPVTPAEMWKNSILVGPQTAGIPTVHNEDSWTRDSSVLESNDDMVPGSGGQERTGGAVEYHRSQRRR